MKAELKLCPLCGHEAEQDWLMIDVDWQQFYIGCSNDCCNVMLSLEMSGLSKSRFNEVEQLLATTWNQIYG